MTALALRQARHLSMAAIGPALMAAPSWACAHSPVPGIGHFYNGVLHPFVVPAHVMALIVLGLLIGQRGVTAARGAVFALLLALAGGLTLSGVAGQPDTDMLLLALSALLGLWVALARTTPEWALMAAGAAVGLAVGLGSSPEGVSGPARWGTLAGTGLGSLLCSLWVAAMVEFARRPWMKIGVRVVASWVAASAMLVLALAWVGPRRDSLPVLPGQAAAASSAANRR